MNNRNGFSRLELVLVLLIVAVLAAVLLPRYLNVAADGERELCELNRSTILRLYAAHRLLHPNCTLSDVLSGACADFEDDTSDYACPGGGAYVSPDNERILCSKHG